MVPEWLDAERLQTVGLLVLLALVVVAYLVMRFVRAVVLKALWLALLVGAGFLIWTERENLRECQQTCSCSVFGQEVAVPDNPLCPDEEP